MLSDVLPANWRQKQWVPGLVNGILLFLLLLVAIYLATQRREAPQLILFLLLYVITANLSLPAVQGAVGMVPIVSVTSILVLDWKIAFLLAVFSLLIAELARRLWNPIWEYIDVQRPVLIERMGRVVIYLASLLIGAFVYQFMGGDVPPLVGEQNNIYSFGLLALAYSASYYLLSFLLWLSRGGKSREYFLRHTAPILMVSLLAQPFALFGATAFGSGGIPLFVVYSLSVMFIAVLIWVNWQQRYVLQQRHNQFAILNAVGSSLRETLDLSEVLERTWRTLSALIAADCYTVALRDEEDSWHRSIEVVKGVHGFETASAVAGANRLERDSTVPDDFTLWVVQKGKVLDLTERNMHFSGKHGLVPPNPRPSAWLGVPLHTVDEMFGALVVQRYPPAHPFNSWSREVLLAVAGQASAAIQNARLYRETKRLFNLTDKALAERVMQLQALLDTMHEGVLMLDPQGTIILVNHVAAEMIGRPANELSHSKLQFEHDALKLGHKSQELRAILAQLQEKTIPHSPLFTFDVAIENEDGRAQLRFIERMEAPVIAASNQVIGWLMLFRDVTEEQELAIQRRDLTRMIVHDLRNPVTTVISNINMVEMILDGEVGLDDAQEAVRDARQSSYDMLDMVDSLMDINRMEAGQLVVEAEAINISTLINQVRQRLEVLAFQRQIQLTQQFDADLPLAWADEDMVRRVLVNLVDNALKYTPSGGLVECRALPEPAQNQERNHGVRCVVADNGPGIPAEYRDQIFNRFARTNQGGARIRGTGLGLAFCKLAIEAHDGRIWVEDKVTGGSEFIFTLPGVPIVDESQSEPGVRIESAME